MAGLIRALIGKVDRMVKWFNRTKRNIVRAMKGLPKKERATDQEKGTYVQKYNAAWLKQELAGSVPIRILVWRSASVRFLRTFIHPWLGGKLIFALVIRPGRKKTGILW